LIFAYLLCNSLFHFFFSPQQWRFFFVFLISWQSFHMDTSCQIYAECSTMHLDCSQVSGLYLWVHSATNIMTESSSCCFMDMLDYFYTI
jgi:hypothetical protein